MTVLGWILIIGGALVVGLVAQLLEHLFDWEWLVTGAAAFVGALAASEWLFPTWAPEWEGVAVWAALVGGLVVAIVVDLAERYFVSTSGGQTMSHGPVTR